MSNHLSNPANGNFAGHPKALYVLFFTEFWERFSFYGIQASLVLYAIHQFNFDDPSAVLLYGSYLAINYATPVVGGLLADKLLGHRHAIYIGSVLLILGNLTLTITEPLFLFLGLAIITIGTGFFKSNISTLVGKLYSEEDPRRDSAFTIFYMGINLGGILGAVIYGLIAMYVGWTFCFILGSIGMASGLLLFHFKRSLLIFPETINKKQQSMRLSFSRSAVLVYPAIALFCAVFGLLLFHTEWVGHILEIFTGITLIGLFVIAMRNKPLLRKRIFALFLFCCYYMVWAACFFQTGGSLTLFIERNIERHQFGIHIPAAVFFSIEALFIVSLAPVFAKLWTSLNKVQCEPSLPAKFALGLLLTAFSFFILKLAANQAAIHEYTSPLWIVSAYFFIACGELCISPIGLSAITRLAPKTLVSLFIGIWFLASSIAGYLAGVIGHLASIPNQVAANLDLKAAATAYAYTFDVIFWVVLGVSILAILLIPITKRMIQIEKVQ